MIPLKGNKQIQIKMQKERKKIRDNHQADKKKRSLACQSCKKSDPVTSQKMPHSWAPRGLSGKTHRWQTQTNTRKGIIWFSMNCTQSCDWGRNRKREEPGTTLGRSLERKTEAWLVGDEPRPEDAETYRRVRGRGRLGERLARRFVEKRVLMERKGEMGLDTHIHTFTHTIAICRTVRHTYKQRQTDEKHATQRG